MNVIVLEKPTEAPPLPPGPDLLQNQDDVVGTEELTGSAV
jgi:hypothetical protein